VATSALLLPKPLLDLAHERFFFCDGQGMNFLIPAFVKRFVDQVIVLGKQPASLANSKVRNKL